MRHICAFSGKRGGFGAYVPLMRRIEDDPDLRLLILLGGQHGAKEFGSTVEEARATFPDAQLELVHTGSGRGDSGLVRAENLAVCLGGAAQVLERHAPEVVLVHGDRAEHLMVAVAALQLGIAVAHTQGGERSGNVDELQRHAISKLAHLHFPETESAAERLRRLGEDAWRIHTVGSTYVDRIVARMYLPPDDARRAVGIEPGEPFLLVIVHPESYRSRDQNRALAEVVLEGARASGLRSLATYPADDVGYGEVLAALRARESDPAFLIRPNVENDVFLGLLAGAEALVGNSSAAFVEAPYLDLPAINVGDRQRGRERDANVADAEPTAPAVASAIDRARTSELPPITTRLGDGRAAERIVETVRQTERDARLLQKQLAY